MRTSKILWRPHPRIVPPSPHDDDGGDDKYCGGGGGGGVAPSLSGMDDVDSTTVTTTATGTTTTTTTTATTTTTTREDDVDDHRANTEGMTFVELIDVCLVVSQETSLAALSLAVHREIVNRGDGYRGGENRGRDDDVVAVIAGGRGGGRRRRGGGGDDGNGIFLDLISPSSAAASIVYISLLVIIYYNLRSSSSSSSSHARDDRNRRKHVAAIRLSDGILLAMLLRLLSGSIKSLTASYSTDTVYGLSIFGMLIHLLACDYGYANGHHYDDGEGSGVGDGGRGRIDVTITMTNDDDDDDDDVRSSATTTANDGRRRLRRHHDRTSPSRPPFLGGTISLNAAFFATVLLTSRIRSNAASYVFVSGVITLFAFYPASRHNIAGRYPNTIRGSPCFVVTIALSAATCLLLSSFERFIFVIVQMTIMVISPLLRHRLQMHKRTISGPWDVAHVRIGGT
ncbi:hypothetical protein ACHAXA_001668 [Cyclostephanos tholiformis]|uniref:Phosphatidylinositol N-acetylglucosaminyltransferase n=1 Tax=Cyclostephanos tholiformis TaxID=382380 RepID=A0ABD3RSX3_9STRA